MTGKPRGPEFVISPAPRSFNYPYYRGRARRTRTPARAGPDPVPRDLAGIVARALPAERLAVLQPARTAVAGLVLAPGTRLASLDLAGRAGLVKTSDRISKRRGTVMASSWKDESRRGWHSVDKQTPPDQIGIGALQRIADGGE